jgi:GT2 family glycosyltransferase
MSEIKIFQRIDFDDFIGSKKQYFVRKRETDQQSQNYIELENTGDWISGGTLRNSLYTAPLIKYTSIKNLYLIVEGRGNFEFTIYSAEELKKPQVLGKYTFNEDKYSFGKIKVCSLSDINRDTRIFWSVESLKNKCEIKNISFATDSTEINKGLRLSILIRTYGKTEHIISILDYINKKANENHENIQFLKYCHFIILDTSSDEDIKKYNKHKFSNINYSVHNGENLGGGGNASQNIHIFFKNYLEVHSDHEVLILDDDLKISLESFFRYFCFLKYKAEEIIVSCPILKDSDPDQIWECGANWGRVKASDKIQTFFPFLEKHLLRIENGDDLDSLNKLSEVDYSAFIFFGISAKVLKEVGFPAAFFLRGDDVELSLRAKKKGYKVLINCNLACWHEPAHLYSQEFMSALHFIIINLKYADLKSRNIINFIEKRWSEHKSIGDFNGAELYVLVIESVVNKNPGLLNIGYVSYYKQIIEKYARIKAENIQFSSEGKRDADLFPNMFYPGKCSRVQKTNKYLLEPLSNKYYLKKTNVYSEWKLLEQRKTSALKAIKRSYNTLKQYWSLQLESTFKHDFWEKIFESPLSKKSELIAANRINCKSEYFSHRVFYNDASTFKVCLNSESKIIEVHYKQNEQPYEKWINLIIDKLLLGLIPKDFSNSRYMLYNGTDVRRLRIHPRLHYIIFSKLENRRYK